MGNEGTREGFGEAVRWFFLSWEYFNRNYLSFGLIREDRLKFVQFSI